MSVKRLVLLHYKAHWTLEGQDNGSVEIKSLEKTLLHLHRCIDIRIGLAKKYVIQASDRHVSAQTRFLHACCVLAII